MAHKYEIPASPPDGDADGHQLAPPASPPRGIPQPRAYQQQRDDDEGSALSPGSKGTTPASPAGIIGAEEQALIDALLADTGSNPEAVELLVAGYKSHHGSAAPSAAASPSPMRSNVNTRDIVVRGAPLRDDVGLPAHRMRPVSMGETLSATSPAPAPGKAFAPAASPGSERRFPDDRADQTTASLRIAALSPARSVHDRQSNAGDTPHDPVVEWATSADQVTPRRDRAAREHDTSAVSPSRVSFNVPAEDSRLGYQANAASSRRRPPPPPPPPGASSDDDEGADGPSPPSGHGRPSVMIGRRNEADFATADVSLPPAQPFHHSALGAAPLFDEGDSYVDPGMPVGLVQTPADLSRQNTARRRPPPPPPPLDSDDDDRPSLSIAASEYAGNANVGFDPNDIHDSIQRRLQGLQDARGAGGGSRRSGRRAATPDYTRHLAAPPRDDADDADSYTSSYSYTYDYGSSSYDDSDDFTDDDENFEAPARGGRGPAPPQQQPGRQQRRPLAIGPPPSHGRGGAADPRGYGTGQRQPHHQQQQRGRYARQPQVERSRPQGVATHAKQQPQQRQAQRGSRQERQAQQGARPAAVVVPRLRGVGSAPASARSSQPRTRAPSGQQHLDASASGRHPPVHSLHTADGRTPPRKRNAAIVSPPPVVQSPGSAASARTVVAVPSHRAPPVDGGDSPAAYGNKAEKAAPRRRGMCC